MDSPRRLAVRELALATSEDHPQSLQTHRTDGTVDLETLRRALTALLGAFVR
jgi:hypothetical protein